MSEHKLSYCTVCDATDPCGHDAPGYIDDVVYERIGPKGVRAGWRVREPDRARFELGSPAPKPSFGVQPKPLNVLVVELEAWVLVERPLENRLREAYSEDPRFVTLLVANIIEQTKAGRLTSPAGLMMNKLRDRPNGKPHSIP